MTTTTITMAAETQVRSAESDGEVATLAAPIGRPGPFSATELRFLTSKERRLGRVATIGRDGTPHVVPSGWTYNEKLGSIDVTGRDVETTKKFRDVLRTPRAAIVIDGVTPGHGWKPWAIEIAGHAEAIPGPPALIRIHPERVRSWGLGGVA